VKEWTKTIELVPGLIGAYEQRAAAYRALGNVQQARADEATARTLRAATPAPPVPCQPSAPKPLWQPPFSFE
jgi:hypothetical protein